MCAYKLLSFAALMNSKQNSAKGNILFNFVLLTKYKKK